MARNKGGLGAPTAVSAEDKEDLLGSVFGTPQSKAEEDTPTPSVAKDLVAKSERVGKYFQIDKKLAKQLKLYAVEHDMKEVVVIEEALKLFLGNKGNTQ